MNKKIITIIIILFCLSFTALSKELELWAGWVGPEKEVLIGLISKYENITGIKIKLKMIPFDALNGRYKATTPIGKGPDLILGPSDWIGQFIVDDLIYPIDEYITENDKNGFIENALTSCIYNDKLYGLPESFKVISLFYNKDLIDSPPKTTTEMIKIGKKFTDIEENKYGLVYRFPSLYHHSSWIGAFNGKLLDKNQNPQFDTKAYLDSFNFIYSLTKGENQIMPEELDEDIAISLFIEGLSPMLITGPWVLGKLYNHDINFEISRIPMLTETATWPKPLLGTDILMLSSKSNLKKEAVEFIKFLTSAESQAETAVIGHLPSRKSVYEFKKVKNSKSFKYITAFKKQAEESMPMPNSPELFIGVWPNGSSTLRKIVSGEMEAKDAFDNAQKNALKDIATYRNTKE